MKSLYTHEDVRNLLHKHDCQLQDEQLLELIKMAQLSTIRPLSKKVVKEKHAEIRREYKELLKNHVCYECWEILSKKYYMSSESIKSIVYDASSYKRKK